MTSYKTLVIFATLIFGIFASTHIGIGNDIGNYNASKEIKFIVVGDPHVNASNNTDKGR